MLLHFINYTSRWTYDYRMISLILMCYELFYFFLDVFIIYAIFPYFNVFYKFHFTKMNYFLWFYQLLLTSQSDFTDKCKVGYYLHVIIVLKKYFSQNTYKFLTLKKRSIN